MEKTGTECGSELRGDNSSLRTLPFFPRRSLSYGGQARSPILPFALSFFLFIADASAGPYSSDRGGLHYASNTFKGWITGYTNYVQPNALSGGFARDRNFLASSIADAIVGSPEYFGLGESVAHVFSLGDAGSITLTFDASIHNGPGPDFAIFENGFTDGGPWDFTSREGSTNDYTFAELAYVDVATTTSVWARFQTSCLNTSPVYVLNNLDESRYASQDVTLLDGFAGKHRIEYGTPFDLSELQDHPAVTNGDVDLSNINFIRLTDVIGDGSTIDSAGRVIYDPYYNHDDGYPSPGFPAARDGFDLRGIGVLNFADVRIDPGPGRVEVHWFAVTNTMYQLQVLEGLGGTWTNLGPAIVGIQAERGITNYFAGEQSRYFRVKRWPIQQ